MTWPCFQKNNIIIYSFGELTWPNIMLKILRITGSSLYYCTFEFEKHVKWFKSLADIIKSSIVFTPDRIYAVLTGLRVARCCAARVQSHNWILHLLAPRNDYGEMACGSHPITAPFRTAGFRNQSGGNRGWGGGGVTKIFVALIGVCHLNTSPGPCTGQDVTQKELCWVSLSTHHQLTVNHEW